VNLETEGAIPKEDRTKISDWKGIIAERSPYSFRSKIFAVKSVNK